MNNWTKKLEFVIITENFKEYVVDVEVSIWCDSNYGADADGNRGVYQEGVDDIKLISIQDIIDDRYLFDNEVTEEMWELINIHVQDSDLKYDGEDYQ